jgi:peptidoglycan/xylan/chitin deacetylase (PgdA/CDA1 family)
VKPRWPRILMYHAVCPIPEDPNELATSPESFAAQMRCLERRNLRGVSMRELRRAVKAGKARGLVGLTFDDGYENFLQYALPILERHGFSATLFAVAGMLGAENDWQHRYEPRPRMKLLGAEGLREVSARGTEVGAHTMTHCALPGVEAESLEEEVSGSRRVLSEVLDEPVEGFCYPYGAIDSAAVRAVRRAGYGYACAVLDRVERNDYDLPRQSVEEDDSPWKFAVKLKVYPQYVAIKKRLRPRDFVWP